MRLRSAASVPLALLLASGCGLPLPGGTRTPQGVSPVQAPGGGVVVVPPGPRRDAAPAEVVRRFLAAQADPDGEHAIAREFLQDQRAWNDRSVVVYPSELTVSEPVVQGESATVRVSSPTVVGTVSARDGSFSAGGAPLDLTYRLAQDKLSGAWQVVDPPPGLLLQRPDFARSFTAVDLHFLAPAALDGATRTVADHVFLPVGSPAQETEDAVRQLVEVGPSSALADGVVSRVPRGTTVRSVTTEPDGTAVVDLTGGVALLGQTERRELLAQLALTLRGLGPSVSQLRLEAGGHVLPVSGEPDDVDLHAFDDLDPDGIAPHQPLYYLDGKGHLQVLAPADASDNGSASATSAAGRVVASALAVAPDRVRVALLQRLRGRTDLRLGTLAGETPLTTTSSARPLSSLSWGAGTSGVWLVEGQRDLAHVPVSATLTGAPALEAVPVQGRPAGPLQVARLSRDGTRVALVFAGRLYVGTVERGTPRVVALRPVAPTLHGVKDVAWESATTLVALGSAGGDVLPYRVEVDGSSLTALLGGVQRAAPTAVTATPDAIAVTAGGALYQLSARASAPLASLGSAPAYPG